MATILRYKPQQQKSSVWSVSVAFGNPKQTDRKKLFKELLEDVGISGVFKFETEENGKPYILSDERKIHISLSHTSDITVAATKYNGRIGVDIEKCNRKVSTALQTRIISNEHEKAVDILTLWTIKEAFLKMTGTGLRTAMKDVEVIIKEPHIFSVLGKNKEDEATVYAMRYRDYALAVAVDR